MNELVVQLAARAGAREALAKQALAKQALAKQIWANKVPENEGSKNSEGSKNEVSAKKTPAKKAFAKKAVGKKAVAIILGSLPNEGAAGTVQALIDKIPDAKAAFEGSARRSCGLSWQAGRTVRRPPDGAEGQADRAWLSMGQIQSVFCELLRLDRDRVAADRMGEIIAGTLGLRQFG